MNLDIRAPMGLLFVILGILLVGYGFASNAEIYQRSLGQNLNLIWGTVFALLGGVMLLLARMSKGK